MEGNMERDEKGRFLPGHRQSVGNKGKSVTAAVNARAILRDSRDAFDRAISQEERAALIRKCWDEAQHNPEMAAFFLQRTMPEPPKAPEPGVHLGDVDAADPAQLCQAVMARLATGDINPTQSKQILGAIESLVGVVAALQIGPKLEAMQERLEQLSR